MASVAALGTSSMGALVGLGAQEARHLGLQYQVRRALNQVAEKILAAAPLATASKISIPCSLQPFVLSLEMSSGEQHPKKSTGHPGFLFGLRDPMDTALVPHRCCRPAGEEALGAPPGRAPGVASLFSPRGRVRTILEISIVLLNLQFYSIPGASRDLCRRSQLQKA